MPPRGMCQAAPSSEQPSCPFPPQLVTGPTAASPPTTYLWAHPPPPSGGSLLELARFPHAQPVARVQSKQAPAEGALGPRGSVELQLTPMIGRVLQLWNSGPESRLPRPRGLSEPHRAQSDSTHGVSELPGRLGSLGENPVAGRVPGREAVLCWAMPSASPRPVRGRGPVQETPADKVSDIGRVRSCLHQPGAHVPEHMAGSHRARFQTMPAAASLPRLPAAWEGTHIRWGRRRLCRTSHWPSQAPQLQAARAAHQAQPAKGNEQPRSRAQRKAQCGTTGLGGSLGPPFKNPESGRKAQGPCDLAALSNPGAGRWLLAEAWSHLIRVQGRCPRAQHERAEQLLLGWLGAERTGRPRCSCYLQAIGGKRTCLAPAAGATCSRPGAGWAAL